MVPMTSGGLPWAEGGGVGAWTGVGIDRSNDSLTHIAAGGGWQQGLRNKQVVTILNEIGNGGGFTAPETRRRVSA